MSNLTLEDVTEQTGVSCSTVSRVLDNHTNVSENVQRHVRQIIRSTGYHPHTAARSLASACSWMIGLVLPYSVSSFFTDPYFLHLTQGIAQACNQFNYTLGLFLISTREDEEKIFPQTLRSGLLDGVIVQSGQIGDHLIERLVHSNISLVVAGCPFSSRGVSYIDVDNVQAAYQAVYISSG